MPHTLRNNYPFIGQLLQVEYQAKHHKLYEPALDSEDDPNNLRFLGQRIEIPEHLVGALQAYVGHSIYSAMEGDGNVARSQALLARYHSICNDLTITGTVQSTISKSESLFEQRGFV